MKLIPLVLAMSVSFLGACASSPSEDMRRAENSRIGAIRISAVLRATDILDSGRTDLVWTSLEKPDPQECHKFLPFINRFGAAMQELQKLRAAGDTLQATYTEAHVVEESVLGAQTVLYFERAYAPICSSPDFILAINHAHRILDLHDGIRKELLR